MNHNHQAEIKKTGLWQQRRSERLTKRPCDTRSVYQRDRARLIHSLSFRRLQGKTQVIGQGDSDFYRSRLTHSMEVAQIGAGLVDNLKRRYHTQDEYIPFPETALIETLGLAHDIGHPPFGHGGEQALNYLMRADGGFEGNGQTLRLLSHLTTHTTPGFGLDMTRRTLVGVLKYPAPYSRACGHYPPEPKSNDTTAIRVHEWLPPKCFFDDESQVVDWALGALLADEKQRFMSVSEQANYENMHYLPKYAGFDTTLLNLADDIAYAVHDLEDAIFLGFISAHLWEEVAHLFNDSDWAKRFNLESISHDLFAESYQRKQMIGALVHAFISSVEIEQRQLFKDPLFDYQAFLPQEVADILQQLKELVKTHFINRHGLQALEYRGQQIIMRLFEALASDPSRLLPHENLIFWQQAESEAQQMRVLADYVSGMTDEYATRLYERLFIPRAGSIFDRY
ncbi:Deoxyguanosinetriphosphate triphosphohydrolase [Piscirickettsia salmonis]|uniref:Deoxyguanosinetriphosphate triphosphohydrolase-like protein n=1 Tax=Piscirickettsia salmonis TaxID=1238 RepID=A0A1L6TBM8_PISSA|nr:anti-phage deoxyguanosine triphosphatase [Piscirickettsia salmonis]AKP73904.1 dGTPase [Piscirickettsia salmonis LF-89 = ATCC VR-1361]ALB22718.1 dGTPase [Piscirickettsia salmonis]ALY02721.1 dGTPase [Piscirickettsia salmonis]AMA42267.1 dGTPase [Piscirickettsia salmonis]AOS34742.1 dGTPase [Piscirickettsia salmonis]